jgi:hypothetical protein
MVPIVLLPATDTQKFQVKLSQGINFCAAIRCLYMQLKGCSVKCRYLNNLTTELNPSAERCLTRFLSGDFDF